MHSTAAVADPPLRAQVHPDKCSHPHATSAFEVLGHANQQLQSEEVMHELRHVLTLARGAPPSPSFFLAPVFRITALQAGSSTPLLHISRAASALCALHAAFISAQRPNAACMGYVAAEFQGGCCEPARVSQSLVIGFTPLHDGTWPAGVAAGARRAQLTAAAAAAA